MKAISTILTCYFALMAFSNISAQVVADFTMSASSGCSPLTVDFTDKSTGTGPFNYTWDLGNGNPSSLQNPQAIYTKPGTYSVKLTVTGGGFSNSITKTITVFKNPVADFTASKTKGCTPLDVTFTDASTKGDANIVKWNWDFRNGEIRSEQSPRLSYSTGNYTVFLEVIDANNCKSNKEKINYIDVANPPMVSFSANPSTWCKIPATVQLDNGSTGAGNLTYNWVFAPGATSTDAKPKYTYTAFGTYNVSLTVNSDYGCSSTLSVPSVVIEEVNAAGTLKQGTKTITNNSIICAGEIDYTNNTTGGSDFMWDFGDEFTSTSSSGKHTYTTPGQYKILLIASPGTPCADTVAWNVTVEKATANFSMTPEKSCNRSTPVSFVNQSSSNVVKYNWVFHDKTTSPDKDVSKTYTEKKDRDEYVIHEPSYYPVKLIVTSTNGCKDSIEKVLTVQLPTAIFSPSTVQGCVPLKVSFNDYSSSDDPINNRIWKFGEGADEPTVSTSITHTYNTPGTYEVKLTVVTDQGCRDTSNIIKINAGSKVTPDFTVTPSFCNSQKIDFTYLSPAGSSKWHYFVGGKSVPSCPDVANPSVYMKTDTGSFDVKLIVEQNGCFSEVTKTKAIRNTGPVGRFTYNTDCTKDFAVNFDADTMGCETFKWEFGDETSTDTKNLQLTYYFTGEKDYVVKFIAFKGSCSDTTIQIVKVRKRDASFTLPLEKCAGDGAIFNSSLSHSMARSCGEKYLWNFGDNSQQIRTRKDAVSHSFENGGTYTVKLYAFYDDGCIDSADHTIRVYKPRTKFTVDKKKGCTPITVTFTDESVPDVHPLNSWTWDFQEGTSPLTYTTQKTSVTNTFEAPGQYLVSLTVGDNFGCVASFIDTVSTAIPTAGFSSSSTGICLGSAIDFFPDFLNPDSTLWDFGNGHKVRSRDQFTRYLYPDSGVFDVTLTLYKYGCSATQTTAKYATVQKADASFTASDTTYNCYPRSITFTHIGSKNVESGKWYYGHNNNSSPGYTRSTVYNYNKPGEYIVALEMKTSFGCADTSRLPIKITGPTGKFSITPKDACKGDEITYTVTELNNVQSFKWDLGDGNLASGNSITHRYDNVGNITAKLILYGQNIGCAPAITDSVHIYEVEAGIEVADTAVCEGTTIDFVNTSQGANTTKWDFGDNSSISSTTSPSHLFNPGTFKVALMTEGLYGCKDTAIQYIVVSKMPILTVSNDTIICIGGSASIKAESDKDVRWEPETYLTSSTIPNPIATPDQTVNYVVFATDPVSQCFKKDSVLVTVQQIPTLQIEVEDSSIIAGRPVQINAITEEGATFVWTPSDFLSCSDCSNPIATTRVNTSYNLKVTDKNKCFTVTKTINLTTEEGEKAFDMASAFTPSGAEPNNIFKVQGYNIKQLLEFRIYNRWGNLVFSSTDLSKGWDGTYQGKAQPVDSYVYTVKIETFDGRVETKTGTILLLR